MGTETDYQEVPQQPVAVVARFEMDWTDPASRLPSSPAQFVLNLAALLIRQRDPSTCRECYRAPVEFWFGR